MADQPRRLDSICVYCGSSDDADPDYIKAANEIGAALAEAGIRLVYGGGGVGLMGACARGAHEAGGRVLGVIPSFLRGREQPFDDVETRVVETMAERKQGLYENADGFVVLPGGIGTLEEVVELLSWQRLGLHDKPVVFYSPGGFWEPLFKLFHHTIEAKLTPPSFAEAWRSVETPGEVVAALKAMAAKGEHALSGPEVADAM